MKTEYAFLITTFAGLSTLLGTIPIFLNVKPNKLITFSFSFAIGVMLTVSFIDLLPESSILLSEYFHIIPTILFSMIAFVIGVIISFTIDKKLHIEGEKLYKVGIISMIAIILHNIPEGIVTYITSSNNPKLGITLALSIALHNIPEGICIATPIYLATKKRGRAVLYTLLSGLSELVGAVLSYLFLSKIMTPMWLGLLYSVIAGIMTHLAIYEMLPNLQRDSNKWIIILLIAMGGGIIILSHILI